MPVRRLNAPFLNSAYGVSPLYALISSLASLHISSLRFVVLRMSGLLCFGLGMSEVEDGATFGMRPSLVLDAKPRRIGTKLFDGHLPIGGLLYGDTVVKARLSVGVAVLPLTDLRIALRTYTLTKLGDRK